jgi:hypothetical protein
MNLKIVDNKGSKFSHVYKTRNLIANAYCIITLLTYTPPCSNFTTGRAGWARRIKDMSERKIKTKIEKNR